MTRNARAYSAYDPAVAPVAVHPVDFVNQLWYVGAEVLGFDEDDFVDNVSSALGLLPADVRVLRGGEEDVEEAEEKAEEAEEKAEEAVEKAEEAVENAEGAE